jgi:hypothetical protein
MADIVSEYLRRNPDLFINDKPVAGEWYREESDG